MNKLIVLAMGAVLAGCAPNSDKLSMPGRYGYDLEFFQTCNIESIDLASPDGNARILIVPAYQGRVMTSTADGLSGISNGWINHDYIRNGVVAPHMHAVGGEERFWVGPEGGPYSYYFSTVENQVFDNWQVPAFIDTDAYEVKQQTPSQVVFEKRTLAKNASGNDFDMLINRTITLLDNASIESSYQISIPKGVKYVGYEVVKSITNMGRELWTKEKGLPSIWALSMINAGAKSTILVPYRTDVEDPTLPIFDGSYFGEIPADRIKTIDGMIYFKADANYRAKMGTSYKRTKPVIGSYEAETGRLTLLWFTLPAEEKEYVNCIWGNTNPYMGDVVNTYNDGPVADGTQFGKFYELETSSPAAALQPNESVTHAVRLSHFYGTEAQLNPILETVFGIRISDINQAF